MPRFITHNNNNKQINYTNNKDETQTPQRLPPFLLSRCLAN